MEQINMAITDKQECIRLFHEALLAQYPGLHVRWMRIYGKRWAHIYGDSSVIAIEPLMVKLNPIYGLSIDNPDLIPPPQLDEIIALLKEFFSYASKV